MPNTDLFDLIKSLNEREKKYFIQNSRRGKNEEIPQYIILLGYIDAMSEYDELKLIENLLKNNIITDRKNFPEAKKNLYAVLMRSLRNYHSEKNRLIKLQEIRTNISILMEKGLWEQAQRVMRKARKIASEGALILYDLEFSLLDRRLTRQVVDNASPVLLNLQQESEVLMKQLRRELLLLWEYEKLFMMVRNENTWRKDVEQLPRKIKRIIGGDADIYLHQASFASKTHYYGLYSLYYRLKAEYDAAKEMALELVKLFEETPDVLEELDNQEGYLNTLNNYFNICYLSNTLDDTYETIISKIQKIPNDNYNLQVKKFSIESYIKMVYLFRKKDYKAVVKMAPKIFDKLEEYGKDILINRRLTFLFNITIAYFLTQDYPKALQINNRIINDRKFRTRADIQLRAKLIRVILMFSMKEYEVVQNMIRSVNRDVAQAKQSDQVLVLVINKLDEISKLPHAAHKAELLKLYHIVKNDKDYQDEDMSYWLENYLGLPHPHQQANR